jgi:uncharacterized membrane protein (DUF485 family)
VASTFGFALSALAGWAARREGASPWLAMVGVGLFLAALGLFATACVLAVVYQDDAKRYYEALAEAEAEARDRNK